MTGVVKLPTVGKVRPSEYFLIKAYSIKNKKSKTTITSDLILLTLKHFVIIFLIDQYIKTTATSGTIFFFAVRTASNLLYEN